jgi:hypothetical protein
MPSRTVVYGVGAATGLLVGAVIAGGLGRDRLRRLFAGNGEQPAGPTHIVLPDVVAARPAPPEDEGAVLDGRANAPSPLTSA